MRRCCAECEDEELDVSERQELQSARTPTEPELPATNAGRTMAAFVSAAGALMRKAIDSR